MPAVSVNAELSPTQEGPRVIVFIDGRRVVTSGPFADWYAAQGAALTLTDEIGSRVRAAVRDWLNASRSRAIGEAPVEQAVTHKLSPLQTGTEGSVPEGWKSIGDQAKSGEPVLLYFPDMHPHEHIGQWSTWLGSDELGRFVDHCDSEPFETGAGWVEPTHWMPLPTPPVLERQGNNHADGTEPVVVEKANQPG